MAYGGAILMLYSARLRGVYLLWDSRLDSISAKEKNLWPNSRATTLTFKTHSDDAIRVVLGQGW